MSNVTQLPPPPRRCEFPQCAASSEGMAKKFNKHLCNAHRKILLLADSFLQQIEDDRKVREGSAGIIGRLQQMQHKAERVFVLDKSNMDEIMEFMSNQETKLAQLHKEMQERDAQPKT